jgi:hypothetical protein
MARHGTEAARAIIAPPVAHRNRISRQEGGRPAWRDKWYHRPIRMKRLMQRAVAKMQEREATTA